MKKSFITSGPGFYTGELAPIMMDCSFCSQCVVSPQLFAFKLLCTSYFFFGRGVATCPPFWKAA